MGDDSASKDAPTNVQDYMAHYAALGIRVTGAKKGEDPGPIESLAALPFTSHNYDLLSDSGPDAVFDNVEKLALRLALVNKVERDQATGVLFAVRHSPHKEVINDMIVYVNPSLSGIDYVEGAGISLETFL